MMFLLMLCEEKNVPQIRSLQHHYYFLVLVTTSVTLSRCALYRTFNN